MPPNSSCELPLISVGRPARSELKRSIRRSSSGSTLYLRASSHEQRLELGELVGHLGGEVVRLGPVGVGVVELPGVVVERRQRQTLDPRRRVAGDRGPALVVDAAVAEHLEVLRLVALGRVGVVERVAHAHALVSASARRRGRSSGSGRPAASRTVGATSMTWWNWWRISPRACDAVGPVHDRAVARAAPVRGDLLGPLIRRVHRVRPADRVVVVGLGRRRTRRSARP